MHSKVRRFVAMKCKLSPSSLNLLEDCPRCFWLQMVKNIKRPSGPWASIPLKMDRIIKGYFNRYRSQNKLPPMIDGKVPGRLAVGMPNMLNVRLYNGFSICGKPDDYLKLDDGRIAILDHKTKSKEPDSVHRAYQLQMDIYYYLLEAMGYKTVDRAYLAFYYPGDCDLHDGMPFSCKVIYVKTSSSRAVKIISKAFKVLGLEIPDPYENCEYCKWKNDTNFF